LIAAKYNLIITDVYHYNGRAAPASKSTGSYLVQAKHFWMRRIQVHIAIVAH
jgi:hypothetical protein